MSKKKSIREPGAAQIDAPGRRQFLEGMALSAGAIAFLAKPFERTVLLEHVRTCLDMR